MKVLITGTNGQVGSELVTSAGMAGYSVIAASRSELDITQSKKVIDYVQKIRPDIVINAAAYTAVDKAEQERDLAYAINRDGAQNLAVACLSVNIPLLHISTDYVFDGTDTKPYKETDITSPTGIYGLSKWQGEEAIRKIMKHYIILRVAWVFGAAGNNFVKTMLRLGHERETLGIVADQFGGPTPAKAIAQTLVAFVKLYQTNKTLEWGTYHYCGTPQTTWYDFAEEIFHQAKKLELFHTNIQLNAITTEQYPSPVQRPKNSMLDCSKIKSTYNIDMPDWRLALKDVLSDLK